MYLIVALGFGLRLGFPSFMLTTAVANLVSMVPAAPGYVGTFDAGALTHAFVSVVKLQSSPVLSTQPPQDPPVLMQRPVSKLPPHAWRSAP